MLKSLSIRNYKSLRDVRLDNVPAFCVMVGANASGKSNFADALDFLFARGKYEGRRTDVAPKVVLLDLKLPKVNGLEVLRTMKGDPHLHTIPVVMVTSSPPRSTQGKHIIFTRLRLSALTHVNAIDALSHVHYRLR